MMARSVRCSAAIFSLAALMICCGPSSAETGDDDAATELDASGGSGDRDATQSGSDALPAATINVIPLCQPHTRTIRYQDGWRTVFTSRWAIIDGVGPGDDFTIEQCNLVTTQIPPGDCPTGATCTGSTAPAGSLCQLNHRVGGFVDGKLLVTCGGSTENYDPSGSLISSATSAYQVVRVMH